MSIGNVILQHPAGHLITDSGSWNRDGTLAELKPKVIASDRHKFAFTAQSSYEMAAGLWQEIEVLASRSGAAFSGGLVAENLSDLFFTATCVQGVGLKGLHNSVHAQFIWYDELEARARALLISNGIMDDGLEPFKPQPITVSFGCGVDVDAPFGQPLNCGDPKGFDVRRDGLRLAQEQRQRPWSLWGQPPAAYVAGTVYLTTVDQAGARTEGIGGWEDPIGEEVRADRPLLKAAADVIS